MEDGDHRSQSILIKFQEAPSLQVLHRGAGKDPQEPGRFWASLVLSQ